MLRNYSPDNISFSFSGFNIVGFQDGTFIDIERKEDGFTMHTGALGDVTRTKNLNRTGKITLTLMAEAPSNDILAAIAASDETLADGVGVLQMTDVNSTVLVHADQAWVMKMPKIERAKESGAVVWIFECANLEIFAGGNVL